MSVPHPIDPSAWKAELADFRQATDTFHAGGLAKAAYKGFSGYYGIPGLPVKTSIENKSICSFVYRTGKCCISCNQ